jgi:hypothetical protein
MRRYQAAVLRPGEDQLGGEPLPTTEPAVDAVDGRPATRLKFPESRFLAESDMAKYCRGMEST